MNHFNISAFNKKSDKSWIELEDEVLIYGINSLRNYKEIFDKNKETLIPWIINFIKSPTYSLRIFVKMAVKEKHQLIEKHLVRPLNPKLINNYDLFV